MTDYQKLDGIYYSRTKKDVSYPEDGNDQYFMIEENSFWFKHRNLIISSVIQKHIQKSQPFFDLGGGNGFVAKKIMSLGYDVTFVEAGPGVFNAKKRGVSEIYSADIVGFTSSKTDAAAGLFDVVEHFQTPERIYNSIRTNMPGVSTLVITVPAYQWLWSEDDLSAGHFRRYTKASITKELESSGFKVVFSSYFFSILILPIFLFRRIPYLFFKAKNVGHKTQSEGLQVGAHTGIMHKIIGQALSAELCILGKIPFGGSIIVVAQKEREN